MAWNWTRRERRRHAHALLGRHLARNLPAPLEIYQDICAGRTADDELDAVKAAGPAMISRAGRTNRVRKSSWTAPPPFPAPLAGPAPGTAKGIGPSLRKRLKAHHARVVQPQKAYSVTSSQRRWEPLPRTGQPAFGDWRRRRGSV